MTYLDPTQTDPPWKSFRTLMPVSKQYAYFDHAAVGPLSLPASQAVQKWCQEITEQGDVPWLEWNQEVETTRVLAAKMIGAAATEVALIPNTTTGINLVAEGYPWQAGDNLVFPENEFPSNAYPWMALQEKGVEIRKLPMPKGKLDLDQLDAYCDQQTRIVAMSWVHYLTGYRIDIEAVTEIVHQHGALFFLDAIQGLGIYPLDMATSGIDFLAADGHKWLLSPEGAGIFYCKREHLTKLRPIGIGWNSVSHPFEFSNLELDLKADASRYEGGTLNMPGFLALGANLKLFAELGVTPAQSPLAQRILKLADLLSEKLKNIGCKLLMPNSSNDRSGIVTFSHPKDSAVLLRQHCLKHQIVLSQRSGYLRASLHGYNHEQDIEQLIEALKTDFI